MKYKHINVSYMKFTVFIIIILGYMKLDTDNILNIFQCHDVILCTSPVPSNHLTAKKTFSSCFCLHPIGT